MSGFALSGRLFMRHRVFANIMRPPSDDYRADGQSILNRRAFLYTLTGGACLVSGPTFAAEQGIRNRCAAGLLRIPARGALRRTAEHLRAQKAILVLAIGSSSTLGVGASSPAASYPAVLELALTKRFPGAVVEVINAGKAGEAADGALERLNAELDRIKPNLVLWQLGTNDALNPSISEPKFEATVKSGILSIEQHNSDALLIDPQFTTKIEDSVRYQRFVDTLERVAEKQRIPLFSRYYLMKAAVGFGVEPLLAPDGLHMNDAGYARIAECLAGQIQDLTNQPSVQ